MQSLPSSNRNCTDLICLMFFLLFTMGLCLAGLYATTRDNTTTYNQCQLDKVCKSISFVYEGVRVLRSQWKIILTGAAITLFTSVLMVLFLRLTSPFLMYFLITLGVFSLFFMSVYLLVPLPKEYLWKGSPIVSVSVGVVLMLMAIGLVIGACCFKRRIALAGSVIEVAGDVGKSNNTVLLLPVVITLSIVCYTFLFTYLVESMSYFKLFSYLLPPLLLIFHFLWSMLFILHTSTFLISGTAINCYYSLPCPYSTSITNYLQYHSGSVAMGSFMNVLFGIPKVLFQVFTDGGDGCCGGFFKKCCGYLCCLCSTFAFDLLNSASYAFIHLTKQPYCSSSLAALQLSLSLPVPSLLLSLFLSIFSIALPLILSILSFLVTYRFSPLVFQPVSYCISRGTIGVMGDSITGIFVCFMREIANEQRKQGYSPQELREWMRQSAKQGHQHIIQ